MFSRPRKLPPERERPSRACSRRAAARIPGPSSGSLRLSRAAAVTFDAVRPPELALSVLHLPVIAASSPGWGSAPSDALAAMAAPVLPKMACRDVLRTPRSLLVSDKRAPINGPCAADRGAFAFLPRAGRLLPGPTGQNPMVLAARGERLNPDQATGFTQRSLPHARGRPRPPAAAASDLHRSRKKF